MITPDKLIEAGYVRFTPAMGRQGYRTDHFQKRVAPREGVLYYINLYRWEFPDGHVSWSSEVRLWTSPPSPEVPWFDVTCSNLTDIALIEAFYDTLCSQMHCGLAQHS